MAAGPNAALLDEGAAAMATAIAYIQLHSTTPDASGSNECTSARKAVTCTHSGGVITIPQTDFTDLSANEATEFLGYWSALTGGVFYGYDPLTGDQTANAAGAYTVNASTITGSGS